MRIQVNGELREIDDELPLSALVSILNLKPEQIAIELNKEVVRRAHWVETLLHEGDQVEIVYFVGGGEAADVVEAITEPSAVAPDPRCYFGKKKSYEHLRRSGSGRTDDVNRK